MSRKKVDIIIVNWNAGEQLKECLESIENIKMKSFKIGNIIIVDNASTDDSLDMIKNILLPIKIIKNEKNLGFAAACNIGANSSSGEYILFLNPDTMLFEESIERPIVFLNDDNNSDIAICGIRLVDENGCTTKNCARFPKAHHFIFKSIGLNNINNRLFKSYKMTEWDHDENRVVDQVLGAFFLVRSKVFFELNGFDEQFFVYYEEVDFSYRVFKLGLKTMYLSEASAYHKGGGTSESIKATRLYYNNKSKILYSKKNFDKLKFAIVVLTTILVEPLSRIVFSLIKKSGNSTSEIIFGYKMLYKDLINIIR